MSKITRSHGGDILDPSPAQIAEALKDIEDDNGSFVILETERGFIQTTLGADGGLLIEYKFEDSSTIHRTTSSSLSTQEVAEVFERFKQDDLEWVSAFTWTQEELTGGGGAGCAGVFMLLVLTICIVGAIL